MNPRILEAPWHARIMDPQGRNVFGAGVLVGPRRVVTCAHVVSNALGLGEAGDAPADAPAEVLRIDFPQWPHSQARDARVIAGGWFPERATAGDLAMLEVLGADLEMAPAPLRLAGEPGRRMISVLGHPEGQDFGVWARAMLIARGGPQREWIQLDALRSTGRRIQRGFSGAGVWDEEYEAVVGCVVAADRSEQDRVAWMIPVEVITGYWPELADLLQRGPASGRRPPRRQDLSLMSAEDRERLAAMLFGLRGISDPASRDLFVDFIQSQFVGRLQVDRADNGLVDTLALVNACLEHPGALHELTERLRTYHRSEAEQRLVAEIMQVVGATDPAPLLNVTQRNTLYRLLGVLADRLTADMVQDAYRMAADPLSRMAIDPFDLGSVVRLLETANSGQDGLPPLLVFLEELSRPLPGAVTEDLHEWVDDFAEREDIPRFLISRLRLSTPPSSGSDLVTCYLLTELWPDGPDELRYLSRITLLHGDRRDQVPRGQVLHDGRTPQTITEIPLLFDSVLSGMWEAASVDIDDLIIEFLLPFGLLGHAVDQWEVQADVLAHPVCLEHQVIVRYRDRMSLRRSHGQWREKTRRLRDGRATVRWTDPYDADDVGTRLFGDLIHGAPCLALVRPPLQAHALGRDAVSIGIMTGVPVIVWCRDEASARSFTSQLRVQTQQRGVIHLPDIVQQLRTDSVRHRDPVGAHITLIWDLEDEPTLPGLRHQAPARLGRS
jgi:hypothetical protein